MKKLLLSLLIAACSLQIQAQEIFQKTIGGSANDYATAIAQTTNGGFVMTGDTYSFGALKSDIYVVKFDSHGNLLWNKKYASRDYDHSNCITATNDGGCIVGGVSGGNNNNAIAFKIDAAGSLAWSKAYKAKTRHSISSIARTPDGGYILGGSASTYDNGSWPYIIKTDADGNAEWSKFLGDLDFYPGIQKLVVTKDSGYAVIVNKKTTNGYYDIFLIKLKKDGSFQWAKSVGGESTDMPNDLIQTSDGGYAVAASTFDLNTNQFSFMYVFKTDSIGNFIFAKRIKGTSSDICRTIAETNDQQLLISGTIPSPSGVQKDVFVMKMDTKGKIEWTKILANDSISSDVRDIIHASDGSYAIAGAIGGYNAQDFLLVKFDTAVNTCGLIPAERHTSDFGIPVTQTLKITDIKTTVYASYGLQDVAGISASLCNILPVSLLSFSATKGKGNVLLEWKTAQEINLKSFEIYRSANGFNYKLLTTVIAHGSQSSITSYDFTDAQPNAGTNFYKLKSTDKDGRYYFSEIRTIEMNKLLAKIFPNPVKDWLHMQLTDNTAHINLSIYSTDGKKVFQKMITALSGEALIDVRKLSPGIYSLNIVTETGKSNSIFIKN